MFYILTDFSPNMLDVTATVRFTRLQQQEARGVFDEVGDIWEVKRESPFISAISNEAQARIVSNILYTEIPKGDFKVTLKKGDRGLIFIFSFNAQDVYVCDWLTMRALLDDGKVKIYYFEVVE